MWSVLRRSVQHQVADFGYVVLGQLGVANEKAHIDCAVENVEKQIEIQVAGEFTAFHPPSKCLVGFLPPGPKKALAKGLDETGVGLATRNHGRHDATAARTKDRQELVHLQAHVLVNRAAVGKMQFVFGTGSERVNHQSTLVRPPAIDRRLAHAGVGKATVYRWWPDKGALVVDAFASSAEDELHFPDSGSVYKDMSLQMNQFLAILRSRRGRIVSAVIAGGQSDPGLIQAFRERFLRPRRQEAYQTLRRGMERGELPRNMDLDLLLDVLYGAIYMRFLIRHDELSEEYISEVCRMVLEGAADGHRSRRTGRRKNN